MEKADVDKFVSLLKKDNREELIKFCNDEDLKSKYKEEQSEENFYNVIDNIKSQIPKELINYYNEEIKKIKTTRAPKLHILDRITDEDRMSLIEYYDNVIIKEGIGVTLESDEKKLQIIDLAKGMFLKVGIAQSLKSDENKLKVIRELSDERVKVTIAQTLEKDETKLDVIASVKNEEYKGNIAQTLEEDINKMKIIRMVNDDSVKLQIATSLKEDKSKIKIIMLLERRLKKEGLLFKITNKKQRTEYEKILNMVKKVANKFEVNPNY